MPAMVYTFGDLDGLVAVDEPKLDDQRPRDNETATAWSAPGGIVDGYVALNDVSVPDFGGPEGDFTSVSLTVDSGQAWLVTDRVGVDPPPASATRIYWWHPDGRLWIVTNFGISSRRLVELTLSIRVGADGTPTLPDSSMELIGTTRSESYQSIRQDWTLYGSDLRLAMTNGGLARQLSNQVFRSIEAYTIAGKAGYKVTLFNGQVNLIWPTDDPAWWATVVSGPALAYRIDALARAVVPDSTPAPAAGPVTAAEPVEEGFVSKLGREVALEADCTERTSDVTPVAGDVGGSILLSSDGRSGQPAAVISEPAVDERPSVLLAGVAASATLDDVAVAVDRRGDDELDMSYDGGATWETVWTGPDIDFPAVSPTGLRYAFVQAGQLHLGVSGGVAAVVALPSRARGATNLSFVGEERLLVGLTQPVAGVDDEFAALVELWVYDIDTASWRRLATGVADQDRWTITRSPLPATDGRILYLSVTGRGSGGGDVRTELWATTIDGAPPTRLREVPIDAVLAKIGSDGSITWNLPDKTGQWHLLHERVDGSVESLGCGRVSFAPPLNGDPDL